MRELTPAIQEQIKIIAKERLGDASDFALSRYTKILMEAWAKGELNLGLEGEE